MVDRMSLDAIFTALTCLSSSNEFGFTPIHINSRIPVTTNNFSVDCQLRAVDLLNAKLAKQSQQLSNLQKDVDLLKGMLRNSANSGNLMPSSCEQQKEGLVTVKINTNVEPLHVICDQETYDGGWLLIARRFDGAVDFNVKWEDYKTGFGNVLGEFFIGLNTLHDITSAQVQELLVIMENVQKETRVAHYDAFGIGGESEKYRINLLGKYQGNAGDALKYHAGNKFSTYDQDNDKHAQSCAKIHAGAWWYADCLESNLFGTFQRFGEPDMRNFKGILWKGFQDGPNGSLKKIKMLLRPSKL